MSERVPPDVLAIDHVARWRKIVERRRAQMDAAYAAAGIANADYWGKRAKAYRQALHQHLDEDPFYLHLRAATDRHSSVIDVGAGPGRHTLALSPHVRSITAVDPSAAMLDLLREDVAREGLSNVTVIQGEWLNVEIQPADAVICSHVLYPIADVVPFVHKLESSALGRVYIYLRTDPLPTDLGLWREFYGVPLQSQPVHMDLVNVLAQIGIFADVSVVEHRFTWTFADLDEAQQQVRNSLCLREDDDAASQKLRRLLSERLVVWPGGRLGPEIGSTRSAIVSWAPVAS